MPTEDWHLDKKVPISLMVGFILQTITLVYVGTTWKSSIDNKIANLELADTVLQKVDESRSQHATRLSVLEEKFAIISAQLTRIENKLDRDERIPR